MYSVTEKYKEKIKNLTRIFTIELNVQYKTSTGENKTIIINDNDISSGSFKHEEATQSSDEFTVGGVFGANISFTLINDDKFKGINFMNARISPNIGLVLDDAGGVEYIPLGVFNVDTVDEHRMTTEIRAIDDMIKLDKSYELSELVYPATLEQIFINICNVGGVSYVNADFPNKGYTVNERPPEGYSLREILSFVAELSGSFARFNRHGSLELKWYEATDLEVTPDNRFNLVAKKYKVQITGVSKVVKNVEVDGEIGEDVTYLAGDEGYVIDLSNNILLQTDFQQILTSIYDRVKNTVFNPYEASWQGNPAVQSGDMVTHISVGKELENGIIEDGEVFNTIITNNVFTFRGSSDMSARGIPENLRSSSNTLLNKIKREVEVEIGNDIARLDQEREQAGQLIANMMGGHFIVKEDAIYIANSPDLESATKVWKWGIGGFGYFPEGIYDDNGNPKNPLTGVTAEGSIVAELIAAKIVSADYIETGTLSNFDGSAWINLDNGYFKLGGVVKDHNGFRVLLDENGKTIEDVIDEKIAEIDISLSDEQLQDIKNYINTDFKIGTLDEAYIENLKLVKRTLTSNKESINREYNATFNNVNLMLSLEKNDLRETFNTLSTHFVNVINTIDSILTDGEINNVTKGLLMDRLNIYTNYIPTYNNAYQAAIEYINLSTDDKIRVARERADSSLNLIDEFNDDKYWTPMEKNLIKFEIDSIKNEYPKLISQAAEFEVSRSGYTTAYNELVNIFDNYILTPDKMNETTYHAGGNSMSTLTAYFDEKIKLLDAISQATKAEINVAGMSAERSEGIANDAQRKADDAFNKATNSQATITNMLDKNQIFPRDKLQIKKEWTTIQNEYSDLITLASQYGLSYALRWVLTNSYENLSGLMITVLEDMDTINGLNSVVVSYFQSYYQAQTDVLNEIAKVTKTDLDKKLATHDLRTELILELDRAKLQAKYIDLVGAVTVLSGIVKPNSQGKRDLGTLEAGLLHGPGMDINLTQGFINIDSASNRAGFTLRKLNSSGDVSHTIIDGNSNMFKIRSADTYTIGLGSTLNTRTYEIYHGLGYTPAFLAYQVDQPTANIPGGVALPAMSIGTREGSKDLSISTIIRASADSENIFIQMIRSTPGTIWRIKVQVFILEEKIF